MCTYLITSKAAQKSATKTKCSSRRDTSRKKLPKTWNAWTKVCRKTSGTRIWLTTYAAQNSCKLLRSRRCLPTILLWIKSTRWLVFLWGRSFRRETKNCFRPSRVNRINRPNCRLKSWRAPNWKTSVCFPSSMMCNSQRMSWASNRLTNLWSSTSSNLNGSAS